MQKKKYYIFATFLFVFAIFGFAKISYAETYISEGYLYHSATWGIDGSPYIIEDTVTIPRDKSLIIDPGVVVIASSTMEGYDLFSVEGSLALIGTEDKHIRIQGNASMDVSFGNLTMKYSDIELSEGVGIYNSLANISSSTITGAMNGITVRSSRVNISNSKIYNNNRGVFIESSEPSNIFPVYNSKSTSGMGGIGNVFLAQWNERVLADVSIENSSILGNSESAVMNSDTSTVIAKNNWWGDEAGPTVFGSNRLSGLVNYMPWLPEDPFAVKKIACCSSVLFIPGIQASRLAVDQKGLFGTSSNQLWEPNRNADVKKLYLDQFGSSTLPTVYSGEPISEAFGVYDIYGKFFDFLDSKKKEGIFSDWQYYGYDWRKPIDEVVLGLENKATTTESLLENLQNMAKNSKTGKVTIIAHSNGGLVTKYLVKKLEELGKSNIIDTVISVAVPYLGTPEAIAGLLHGHDQSIAKGLILNESTARNLGVNMPSAYSLLPSTEFFSKVFGPTIVFASTTIKGLNEGAYKQNISSYDDQKSFVVDSASQRIKPDSDNVDMPEKGNMFLSVAGEVIHGLLDPYYWPSSIARWAVLGYNNDTTKTVNYFEDKKCRLSSCTSFPNYSVTKSNIGDGTVLSASASYNSGTPVSLDLQDVSEQEDRTISHANILGASTTMAVINDIISKTATDSQNILANIAGIQGASIGEPNYSREPVRLVISTHSPVDLHVYDSKGRHVGLAPLPPELVGKVSSDLYTYFEEKIPGASFERIRSSDGTYSSYIRLPDNNGNRYRVEIEGNNIGSMTYRVERVRGADVLDKLEYYNVPITPLTVATTTVMARISETAIVPILSSSTPALSIDYDGNGSPDFLATSSTEMKSNEHIKALKLNVLTLLGSDNKSKVIIKKIDNLAKMLESGKMGKFKDKAEELSKFVGHIKTKKITAEKKAQAVQIIETFLSQFE